VPQLHARDGEPTLPPSALIEARAAPQTKSGGKHLRTAVHPDCESTACESNAESTSEAPTEPAAAPGIGMEATVGASSSDDDATPQVEVQALVVPNDEEEPAVEASVEVLPSSPDPLLVTATPEKQQQRRQMAAKGLFLYVSGVLNGAYSAEKVLEHTEDIVMWLGDEVLQDDSHAGSTKPCWSANRSRVACVSLALACKGLAAAIEAGSVPPSGISVLTQLCERLGDHGVGTDTPLLAALKRYLCPQCSVRPPAAAKCNSCRGSGIATCAKCSGTGHFEVACRTCGGSGRFRGGVAACPGCSGRGSRVMGECNRCQGGRGASVPCEACETEPQCGLPRPLCIECCQQRQQARRAAASGRNFHGREPEGPPSEGVTIDRCSASQLADLKTLWEERQAHGSLLEAWRVDNPLLTWRFHARRAELKRSLGRSADELQGFHGTHPNNVISICQNGFDSGRRCGQVYGAGEYFAKCPDVSVGYCRGGQYMLVCRLTLGVESSSQANLDGDHIWVPECSYYVISSPAQVLPIYILRFALAQRPGYGLGTPQSDELERVLKAGSWTTKRATDIVPVPPNRPCLMSRPTATVLWIGLLHAHLSDEQLDSDVRGFLWRHAPGHTDGLKVQVVKGKFKKAHAILTVPMPRDLVHRLNRLPFVEGSKERTVCVEDAHGSPEQKCPKWIAGYCRGQNLRFTQPCWCWHPKRSTERARYHCEDVSLLSAKGNEIADKFMKSAPFHDGHPRIVGIKAIINDTLSRCHEEYRRYLTTKHGDEPTVRELYHGTNNNILDVLYTHGLQPPSDTNASDACPVSGGKGLTTTLCNNDCRHCTEKHEWGRCHMFGLGIYLADLAQKSHRYCSQPKVRGGKRQFRMIVCSVLGRAFKIEGYLRRPAAMHDVVNARTLQEDEIAEMIEPCCSAAAGVAEGSEVAEKSDMLFIQGLGGRCRPGSSVVNSEYIAYHPHQCLPKYEITYQMD